MSLIKYKTGCLIKAFNSGEIDVLAHGCNCQGVMGSGVARAVKAHYPEAFKAYKNYIDRYGSEGAILGDVVFAGIGNPARIIANMLTQQDYGSDGKQYVNYAAIKYAFKEMFEVVDSDLLIGIPKIGAGLGGGDWDVIEYIIGEQMYLAGMNTNVVCYVPPRA